MTTIETIRDEIGKRIKACKTKNGFPAGQICAIRIETYKELLSFLDSLQELSIHESLGEAAEKSAILQYKMEPDIDKAMKIISARIFHEIGFKAGAEWMKKKMEERK